VRVDGFEDQTIEAAIQSGLSRLGQYIGNMHGEIGPTYKAALKNLGLTFDDNRKKETFSCGRIASADVSGGVWGCVKNTHLFPTRSFSFDFCWS
jgi:hypothetical protein